MRVESADVVVIGAGVSGLTSAYYLAKAGKDVVVVEKGTVGGEASGRNGGMISERVDEPPMIPMAVESLKIWPTLDDELGYPTEFTHEGRLQVAVSEEEMGDLFKERDEALRNGLSVEQLDPSEIQDLIPGITGRTLGGLFFANGGHANPQRSVQAFAWAFQDLGGRIQQHTAVTGMKVVDDRVTTVKTTSGTIAADVVVAAAGPQTGLLAEMVGVHVPVAPARVEIIATAALDPLFDIAIVGNGLYGRQAARGNLLFGGGPHEWIDVGLTSEPGKPNTPLISNIARRLAELLPGVADVPVIRSWAGLWNRPRTICPSSTSRTARATTLSSRRRRTGSASRRPRARPSANWCSTASRASTSAALGWGDFPTLVATGARSAGFRWIPVD